MRILSRPMFRYGGPIKEGVMHGMRNNYQSGQLVRPGPGRPGYQGNPRFINLGGGQPPANVKIAKDVGKVAKKTAQTFAQGLYGKGRYRPTIPNWLKTAYNWVKPGYKTGFLSRWGIGALPALYTGAALKLQKSLPKELKGKGGIYETAGYADPMSAGADVSYDIPEVSNIPGEKLKPIVTKPDQPPGGGDPEMTWTDPDKAKKLAKDAQNKRLKSYLDMMGYDKSKKTAVSKALIDASALVQDATTEAGSLKEADWGKLINKAIQTTSKRLDKPEQIREAVGLMMTKGAIEKDMTAEKDALDKLAKTLQIKGYQKTLAGSTLAEDIREGWKKSEKLPSGNKLAGLARTHGIEVTKVLDTADIPDDMSAIDYITLKVKKSHDDGNPIPPGNYVIKDRLISIDVDGNITDLINQ